MNKGAQQGTHYNKRSIKHEFKKKIILVILVRFLINFNILPFKSPKLVQTRIQNNKKKSFKKNKNTKYILQQLKK